MIEETYPMMIGQEEVATERLLHRQVDSGPCMDRLDSVRFIVIHCSATRPDTDYTVERLLRDHTARGFRTIGYHFYIRSNGDVTQHRRLFEVGAHARPYNRCSIGICYEGGLDNAGQPADTRTPRQRQALRELVARLRRLFPQARVVGHRDLPSTTPKACPCFDVASLL